MYTLRQLFWNRDEARLRAGWRVVVFWIGTFIFGFALVRLRDAVPSELLPDIYRNPVEAGIYLLLVWVVLLGSRRLDRRPIVDYGFHLSKGWWFDLGFGLALGTLLMLGVFVIELAMGWIKVTGTFATADPGQPFGPAILAGFIAFLLVAVQEEVIWRGYSIKNIAEGLNWKVIGPRWATVIAMLISSVVFGLAHADNPGATTFSTINTMLFGLLLLSAGYVLTGELALPIGLHVAWNFVQDFVLGFYGGATQFGASFLAIAEGDPAGKMWTGMPYGHESGLLGTGAIILGFLLIVAWVRLRRGRVSLDPSVAQPPARRAVSAARPVAAPAP
ncbi:MAG: CPBP family intramembrane glutamic endopeptidase [Roseiflexaceae bacterium]